jgi:hypothetical protein
VLTRAQRCWTPAPGASSRPSHHTPVSGSFERERGGATRFWLYVCVCVCLNVSCCGVLSAGGWLRSGATEYHVLTRVVWRVFPLASSSTAGATLDADWRDDSVFATCSNDGSIAVCKMGSDKALKTWPGDPSTEVRGLAGGEARQQGHTQQHGAAGGGRECRCWPAPGKRPVVCVWCVLGCGLLAGCLAA